MRESDEDDEDQSFRHRMLEKQEAWLLPLKEDLADWLNKTLGESHITADNFMSVLDNGVLVCRLAKLIHDASLVASSTPDHSIPAFKFKWWKDARSASFFARDNAENFLKWCRQLGVNEAVMFESESLVLQTQPRTVVLCLLELGRVAAGCGIEPPGIVKLEREIDGKLHDKAKHKDGRRRGSPGRRPLSVSVPNTPCALDCPSLRKYSMAAAGTNSASKVTRRRSISVPETDSKLHRKVLQMTTCCCSKSHVQQVSDGKYIIGSKIVFIRLLNDRHVMVRVGGGWDTLDHFIARHDPCQIAESPFGSMPDGSTDRRNRLDTSEWQRPRPPSKSSSASAINGRTILY